MKKVLLPVLALLLLASGGAGAYFYMGKSSEAATGEAEVAKEEPKAEGEGEKVAYVPMQAIVLPIIDRSGITQTVSLVVSLQLKDPAKEAQVKDSLPKLADAFLSDMYGTLSQKSAMESGVIKVSTLKARLYEIANQVMGPDVVDAVLLQVLQQHPT